jgi:hypothetical protein
MPKHATAAEPTHVERLTQTALATGRSALEKYGPQSAVAAMSAWLPAIERAQRKAERRG